MSPGEAITSVFSNYVNFSGRASRSEFWWWVGFLFLVSIVISATTLVEPGIGILLATIWWLVTIIPYLAVSVRRLHDSGRTGWWMLLIFLPLIGPLILLIFMIIDTEPVTNRWGPPARGSKYAGDGSWSAAPAHAPGQWGTASSGTGGPAGPQTRTKIFTGSTQAAAEAAFRADLQQAEAAGYRATNQRWDTTQPQPTLIVDYEPIGTG